MRITISLQGQDGFFRRMRRVIVGAPASVRKVNRRFQSILLMEARASASGRPGPQIDTGQFVNNMQTEVVDRGNAVSLYNNSPQAARLEYGFVGIDASGRHYRQSPYPWLRRTFDRVAPRYAEEMNVEVEDLVNGS